MKSSRLDLEIVKKYAKKRELLRQKLCLISQQPLLDPVYYEGQDGSQLVFSRARIVGWIQKYGTCPVSGMAIKVDVLRVYHTISSLENHFTECKLLSAEGELLSDALLQEKVSEMKQFVRRRFITELKLGDLPALQEIFADEIGKFVDIVTDGCSTLDIAIFTGKVKIVETLMRHGADLTFTSCGHVSPLDRAISRNEYLIVQLLLDAHATITMQDILSAAGIEGSNKVLDLILDNVASIKPDNKYSKLDILNMLLQKVARKFGSSLTIYRLVSMGADPNNKDSNGDTPLHSAVKVKNNEDNVLALLVSGAHPNKPSRERIIIAVHFSYHLPV